MSKGVVCRQTLFKDLGILNYQQALNIQLSTLESKIENPDKPDYIFFVEHPPVFTLGKNGGAENLIVSESFLAEKGIQVIKTERGGNITYHGLGQIVVYPVINLEKNRLGVKAFVFRLEEILIQTARDLGVQTVRNPLNHGVWVKNFKIGSVGLGIRKNISFHGMALNIHPDLTPFSWINPCGLEGVCVTSIYEELEKSHSSTRYLSMSVVKAQLKHHFKIIFGFSE